MSREGAPRGIPHRHRAVHVPDETALTHRFDGLLIGVVIGIARADVGQGQPEPQPREHVEKVAQGDPAGVGLESSDPAGRHLESPGQLALAEVAHPPAGP